MANPTTSETEENVTKLLRELDFYKTAVEDLDRDLSKAHEDIKDLRTSTLHLTEDYLAVQRKLLNLKYTESRQEETIQQLKAQLELVRQQTIELQNNNQELSSLKKSKDQALRIVKSERRKALEKASVVDDYMIKNFKLIKLTQFLKDERKMLDGAPSCAELTVDGAATVFDDEYINVLKQWLEEPWFIQMRSTVAKGPSTTLERVKGSSKLLDRSQLDSTRTYSPAYNLGPSRGEIQMKMPDKTK